MVTPAVKREAVAHVRSAFELSERRACRMIGCVRMTVRYRSRRPADTELRGRLRALAHERRRFGYRLHVLLRREGFIVNHKRLFRIYCEERLLVRRRGGRKRALGTRAPMLIPEWPNDRWSLDFVADQFIDGRRLRILVVVDDCTRECLALVADSSISGIRVARELERLLGDRGKPKTISSDNGTELTSNAILRWAHLVPVEPLRARDELRRIVGFSPADEIEKLDRLKKAGSITDAEFSRLRGPVMAVAPLGSRRELGLIAVLEGCSYYVRQKRLIIEAS